MIVIGLVGGIASGKSAVAEMFARLGAEVIPADRIGHEVLVEPETVQQLRARWGDRALGPDGRVSRAAIASIVFAPPPSGPVELEFLESVTHPPIGERILARLNELRRSGTDVVVLDAPVLLEAGWRNYCDRIVFVDVSIDERIRRAKHRGWTKAQFLAREANQMSVAEKKKLADKVIDNSSSFDHTFAQIQQFWHSLRSLPPE